MTSAFRRTPLNTSRLIRFLADQAIAAPAESKKDFAEQLGQWLDVADAIILSAVLQSGATGTAEPLAASPSTAGSLEAELTRVRTLLVQSIRNSAPGARSNIPAPTLGSATETRPAYAPYYRHYLAQQRAMEANIGPLRVKARKTLAGTSPKLRQLATLDAAMAQMLAPRERKSLGRVPQLLEKRFEQLYQAHQQASADAGQADELARWMEPGGWLAVFYGEFQEALLAELEVRLQPVTGLIEALSNEANQHP